MNNLKFNSRLQNHAGIFTYKCSMPRTIVGDTLHSCDSYYAICMTKMNFGVNQFRVNAVAIELCKLARKLKLFSSIDSSKNLVRMFVRIRCTTSSITSVTVWLDSKTIVIIFELSKIDISNDFDNFLIKMAAMEGMHPHRVAGWRILIFVLQYLNWCLNLFQILSLEQYLSTIVLSSPKWQKKIL